MAFLTPSSWVLASALSDRVSLLNQRREPIILELLHFDCLTVVDARTAQFIDVWWRILSLSFLVCIERPSELLAIVPLARLIALLVDIAKNCRTKLFLVRSVCILVVHAQLLEKIIVFLLDNCWWKTRVWLLHVLVLQLDGLGAKSLWFSRLLENASSYRVFGLAIGLSVCHLDEQLRFESGLRTCWRRHLLWEAALLFRVTSRRLHCISKVGVWKNWLACDCRLLYKLISPALCCWGLFEIYLSLVNRIRATSIHILIHVLIVVILLYLLVALLLAVLTDWVACHILPSHHGKLAHRHKWMHQRAWLVRCLKLLRRLLKSCWVYHCLVLYRF